MAYKVLGTPVIDDSRNIVNIENLNVSGVSTLGTLKVSSGIVTATTGVITYYGDGRFLNLDGITLDAQAASATTATNVIGGRADVTQLNVSGLSTVTSLEAGPITATGFYSAAGIVTATAFHTGASGSAIQIDSNTISGPSVLYLDPSSVGDNTGTVRVKGDLVVDGVQTIINSIEVDVADKVIGIGSTSSPTDLTADGGGLLLYGGTNKTFTWSDTTDAWTSSEHMDLASGKAYHIGGTEVLSSTTLGAGVTNSSLTSVGTLINLSVGDVNSTGVVTATSLNATDLNVTGVTTLAVVSTGDIYAAGVITATSFSGAFSGTVTGTASTATRAETVDTTATSDNSSYYLSFVDNSSSTQGETLRVDEGIVFNPSSNALGINTTTLSETLNVQGGARVTGAVSANSLTVGGSQVISSAQELQNIATIDETTKATLEAALQISPNNFDDITVIGVSTFNGQVTVNSDLTANSASFSGYVGINSTTPNVNLDVDGDGNISGSLGVNGYLAVDGILYKKQTPIYFDANNLGAVQIVGSGNNLKFYNPVSGLGGDWIFDTYQYGEVVRITNSGNVGLGITNPSVKLDVVGNIRVSGIVTAGDFNSTSDRKLKDNIAVIEDPLAKVTQINGVTFTWKENGASSGGVIAQDVEVVLPEFVSDGEIKTVNYNGLIGLLIESVKELSAEVAELKAKLG